MKKAVVLPLFLSAALFADAPSHEIEISGPNPPAGPVVKDWADFFFTGEFIWWKARQEGLSYAQSGRAPLSGVLEHAGGEADIDADFEPGFKVGMGINWRYDGWDFYTNYTWLNPATHRSSMALKDSTGGMQSIWPTYSSLSATPSYLNLNSASNTWKVDFNVIDAEMGRNFFVSSKLTLRPFFGFKAAWIHQHNTVHYESVPLIGLGTPGGLSGDVELKMQQKFFGFGIRGGVNTAWRCSDQWSVFGNAALSELWCKIENHRHDRDTVRGVTTTVYDLRKKFHDLTPVVELALGLRYTHDFRDGSWRLDLSGAWELQTFFSHNRFLNPVDRRGDFTVQGATARIGFAF
jgi:hypothetical protein